MRLGEATRRTRETTIRVALNLDGEGTAKVKTGVPFLDHLLTVLAAHSLIDLEVEAEGDLVHHTVEDVALTLGEALSKALGDRAGLTRFGYALVPMDCSLALAAVDLVKRAYSVIDLKIALEGIEGLPREDLYHFPQSLASALPATIHLQVLYGDNDHHKVEAAFKALALALRQAATPDPRRRGVPSSKGVI